MLAALRDRSNANAGRPTRTAPSNPSRAFSADVRSSAFRCAVSPLQRIFRAWLAGKARPAANQDGLGFKPPGGLRLLQASRGSVLSPRVPSAVSVLRTHTGGESRQEVWRGLRCRTRCSRWRGHSCVFRSPSFHFPVPSLLLPAARIPVLRWLAAIQWQTRHATRIPPVTSWTEPPSRSASPPRKRHWVAPPLAARQGPVTTAAR